MVRVSGLSKQYSLGSSNITPVNQVSFEVSPGEVVAIMGPSGCGKSTLLRLLGAMEAPDQGQIKVGEDDIAALRGRRLAAYRRSVGFVFQRFHLLPALTALDNVLIPVLPLKTTFDKSKRARELLAEVGMADRAKSQPAQLSGGEQQRVAIARALIGRPQLLIADEPTGSVDSTTGEHIIALLLNLRRTWDMTIVLVTHEQQVADACDRIIHMRDGRLV